MNKTSQTEDVMVLVLFTGVDRAGMCSMLTRLAHIDVTPPVAGRVKCGPYYNMVSEIRIQNNVIIDIKYIKLKFAFFVTRIPHT